MNKPTLQKCEYLLNNGFSLIPIKSTKVPTGSWKQYQTSAANVSDFVKKYNDPSCEAIGICTGYNDLEVVDVDLKVFESAKERVDFWQEFLKLLKDNIYDFEDKFVIVKTLNSGYHILYRTKLVQGNIKLATPKGHKVALIETRGKGGYVVYYENFLFNKYYADIKYISDEDRNILMSIIDIFDFNEPPVEDLPKKLQKEYSNTGLKCWEDFRQKNKVWDIIKDDFKEVYRSGGKIAIKRHGSKNVHSGYIFTDNDILYLHSTATIYPYNVGLTSYACYVWRNHKGDFSAAAKKIYGDGYGDRVEREIKIPDLPKVKKPISTAFPIDVFPKSLQYYLTECNEKLGSSIDFMGCSLLWVASMIIGNSMNVRPKVGWEQAPVLWFALVGKTGVGKSPSVGNIIRPLEAENGFEIKNYIKELEKWGEYAKLPEKEKTKIDAVKKPNKKQFIVGDTTIEALVQLHHENQNGVGIHKDELAGWIKDMNKYRDGSDKETFLSIWDGKTIVVNRVMSESNAYLGQPFIPIIGGIQPSIFSTYYTSENKDSGFLDRILICYPDLEPEYYNDGNIDYDLLNWYDSSIRNLFRKVRTNVNYNEDGHIVSDMVDFSPEAKKEFIRIYNKIVDRMRSDTENEYLKSMLPKQQKYLPRFALCLHLLDTHFGGITSTDINKQTILNAEKLSDYFILNAEKVKIGANEHKEIEKILKNEAVGKNKRILELYNFDHDFDRSKAAEVLECSREYVYKVLNELKKAGKIG